MASPSWRFICHKRRLKLGLTERRHLLARSLPFSTKQAALRQYLSRVPGEMEATRRLHRRISPPKVAIAAVACCCCCKQRLLVLKQIVHRECSRNDADIDLLGGFWLALMLTASILFVASTSSQVKWNKRLQSQMELDLFWLLLLLLLVKRAANTFCDRFGGGRSSGRFLHFMVRSAGADSGRA